MQDHKKSIFITIAVIAFFVALIAWATRTPYGGLTPAFFICRYLVPVAALGFGFLALKCGRRIDLAPDYLKEMFGKQRFDCQGLGFAIDLRAEDGVGWLEVYYQNRYEKPCQGVINLRRAHGYATSSKQRELAAVTINASGGEYGVMRLPLPMPRKWQGKRKPFEINANVQYFRGHGQIRTNRGRLLRFHPGRRVGSPGEATGLVLVGLMFGVVGAAIAAGATGKLRLRYPKGVAEQPEPGLMPEREILWTLEDEAEGLGAVETALEPEPRFEAMAS